jgi:hypothetical protein
MADNVSTQTGDVATLPGATEIATDQVGTAHYQRVKVVWGVDGTANDANATTPLPVDLSASGTIPLPSGAATQATLATLLTEADFDTKVGALTETAPASDTASSGVNGRLQRIAQRLTSLIALVPAALGANGGLKIEGVASGTVVPVSDGAGSLTVDNGGTFAVQAAQSGTWNVTDISGTVSLPTGAATAAKQPALGTAGTASADVITVQGIASMTALKVDGSGVTQPVSGTVTANQGGTWNVGTVTTVTAVTAISNALPSGTNTIGKTYAALQTTKALTNANVSVSSSGENTIVSGTASQTIRVFAGSFTAAGAVTITFKDAASGNTLATIPLAAGGSFNFDTTDSGEPLWVTASSGAFIASLSAAVSVTGFVQYVKS